jgi:hypothetical protein
MRPDRAMCIELLIDIQGGAGGGLERCETLEDMPNVSLHGVFLICGFCAGLHGEEVPLMNVDAERQYYEVKHPDDHMVHHVCLLCEAR